MQDEPNPKQIYMHMKYRGTYFKVGGLRRAFTDTSHVPNMRLCGPSSFCWYIYVFVHLHLTI